MNSQAASSAAQLNNSGVKLFESRRYDEAVSAFSRSLAIVKQVLATCDDEIDAEMSESQCGPSSPVPEASPLCQFSKVAEPAVPQHLTFKEESACDADLPFVFSQPILIPTTATELTAFKHFIKMSFVLLYNLALTHHLSALEGPVSMKKLRKALSLYELAYTVQVTEDIQLTVMQTMAIVNNLGQIHVAMSNSDKADQCFQHLLSTLMYLSDCDDRQSIEQIDGFMSSVMPLILGGSKLAPAA